MHGIDQRWTRYLRAQQPREYVLNVVSVTQGEVWGGWGVVVDNSHFEGQISAVSKPMFSIEYSFFSSCRDLQDLHTFARVQVQKVQNVQIHFLCHVMISQIIGDFFRFCEKSRKFRRNLSFSSRSP